jgi:hypothetical protein
LHLIPQNFQTGLFEAQVPQPVFLNPQCSIGPAEDLPGEFIECPGLLADFALQGTIAWVRDPATRSLSPFWLGPELEDVVRRFRPNKPAPPEIAKEDLAVLIAAGILTSQDSVFRRLRQWKELVAKSSPAFREKGYVPLGNLIHPFHVAGLRRYYRHLIRRGRIRLGDPQSPRRYVAYNEPVARFFHHQIRAAVSAIAGQEVQPSYVYLASYLSGAELKKHTDREQCEFSVTLCLDFSPEPHLETSWPISLETPYGTTTVYQALGDGLVYRGTRVPHYRGVLAPGYTSTSIFFHYVSADFQGLLA